MNQSKSPASSFAYIPQLDSIRFLAFILIFIHHTNVAGVVAMSGLQKIGWVGVDIFLCLSAFLLTRLLLIELQTHKEISFFQFYMRRILRIWPLYFAYLVFVIIISLFIFKTEQDLFRFVTLATFTDNIATAIHGYNPHEATGHLWTISYEEQFYLVLPFAVIFVSRLNNTTRKVILVSIIATGVLSKFVFIYAHASHPAIWVLPVTHFESVIAGIMMAYYYNRLKDIPSVLLVLIFTASLCGIIMAPHVSMSNILFLISYTSAGLLSFSVVTFAINSQFKTLQKLLLLKPICYLGKISYGLYVFHLLSLLVVYHIKPTDNYYIDNLLGLVLCIISAIVSYEIFEKFFLKLKNRKYQLGNVSPS
jgi:peptidoglycan/LPS O-acetylase OafA/YrhL